MEAAPLKQELASGSAAVMKFPRAVPTSDDDDMSKTRAKRMFVLALQDGAALDRDESLVAHELIANGENSSSVGRSAATVAGIRPAPTTATISASDSPTVIQRPL